jgi:hypothetical protein
MNYDQQAAFRCSEAIDDDGVHEDLFLSSLSQVPP